MKNLNVQVGSTVNNRKNIVELASQLQLQLCRRAKANWKGWIKGLISQNSKL